MCMIYDAEEWSVFHEEQRTAAKTHNCTECGRRIDRGERYFYSTGLLDGRWYTHAATRIVSLAPPSTPGSRRDPPRPAPRG